MAAPTFDEFMAEYRRRIEHVCAEDTYGDPTTHADDKGPITVRAMNVITRVNLEIFSEIAVFVDRERLERLLHYLTGEDLSSEEAPYQPHHEAQTLLEQIKWPSP